jgi:hypothetical protein
MSARWFAILLLVPLAVACSDNSQSTTSPSTSSPALFPFYYAGTLSPSGSGFYSFGLTAAGPVSISVVSLSVGAQNPTPNTVVGIGFGTPVGTDCSLTASATTSAGLTAQLTAGAGVGTFCVSVFDVGQLKVATDFVVRIVHP